MNKKIKTMVRSRMKMTNEMRKVRDLRKNLTNKLCLSETNKQTAKE